MSSTRSKERPKSAMSTPKSQNKISKNPKPLASRLTVSQSRKTQNSSRSSVRKKSIFTAKDHLVSRNSCTTRNEPDHKSVLYMFPTHLDVIDRIRKIKNLSNPLPFSPELPPESLPYGKQSLALASRIKERKGRIEYLLPKEPESMNLFLSRIKETERIIRQENEFLEKVRKFKPKIQLVHSDELPQSHKNRRIIKRRAHSKTPVTALRTGIITQGCYG